ncbi:hypothetical protein CAL7716_042260 [Calothrix sp. PCC 7716]|nr:hypothetical protein CAL7716_042260 [Calothrix sp. PCC 7716]
MIETPNNKEISSEYQDFLNHYQDFLKHYNHCSEISAYMNLYCCKKNTDVHRWFQKALQAHIKATYAYREAIEAHRKLTQKVITELTREN